MSLRSRPVSVQEMERRSLGLSQRALAAELGWSEPKLSRFENATLPDPGQESEWRAALERVRLRQSGVGRQVGVR